MTSFYGASLGQPSCTCTRSALRSGAVSLFKKKQPQVVIEKKKKGKREKPSDAKLISDAIYGERKDGKMDRDQYAALARRIRGSASQFFKSNVQAEGEWVENAEVSSEGAAIPGLPFLIAVVVAILGATAYVATQTSSMGSSGVTPAP